MVFKKEAKTGSKRNVEDNTDDPALVAGDENGVSKDESPEENGEVAPKTKKTKAAAKMVSKIKTETDDAEVAENNESSEENGEVLPKAKKAKIPAKKSSQKKTDDVEVAENDEASEENEEVLPKAKKAKTPAKKSSQKKTKVVVPGERKSSRPHKPLAKDGDESEYFEVEKIVEMRNYKGKAQYLIRWKGYSKGDDTWEDESAMSNCPDALSSFKANQPAGGKATKRKSTSKSPVRQTNKATKKNKDDVKEEKDYEVEKVVGVRKVRDKREFKVHWKGYKASDDSWEPEENLSCQDLIKTYLEKQGDDVEEAEAKETKVKKPAKKTTKSSTAKSKRARKTKSGK